VPARVTLHVFLTVPSVFFFPPQREWLRGFVCTARSFRWARTLGTHERSGFIESQCSNAAENLRRSSAENLDRPIHAAAQSGFTPPHCSGVPVDPRVPPSSHVKSRQTLTVCKGIPLEITALSALSDPQCRPRNTMMTRMTFELVTPFWASINLYCTNAEDPACTHDSTGPCG